MFALSPRGWAGSRRARDRGASTGGVLLVALVAMVAGGAGHAADGARECSATERRDLLRKADDAYVLRCSATLSESDTISRPILIEGASGSGLRLDCGGGTIDPDVDEPRAVTIRSRRDGSRWEPIFDIEIRRCRIRGSVRVIGLGRNGEAARVRSSSHASGHTERAQAAAPTRITFAHVVIEGTGAVPLYLAPGVTRVRLRDSRIEGVSGGPAIYLDAEGGRHEFVRNTIATRTRNRELLAIDGSAGNLVADNLFSGLAHGAIRLYRNCGEGGTVRHQTPSANIITGNRFEDRGEVGPDPVIWIGSRMGRRSYCAKDAGYAFGSSADDRDFARGNVVTGNVFVLAVRREAIRADDGPNEVTDNQVRYQPLSSP